MAFDLRISEIFSGQSGSDLTSDWFEITNVGTSAWVQGVDAALFYDDDSADATTADAIRGLTAIEPGESVIVLVDSTDVAAFEAAWGDVRDLSNVQIGTIESAAGLGGGGDEVTLFADRAGDGVDATDLIDSAAYPDTEANDGQTWDVAARPFRRWGSMARLPPPPWAAARPMSRMSARPARSRIPTRWSLRRRVTRTSPSKSCTSPTRKPPPPPWSTRRTFLPC